MPEAYEIVDFREGKGKIVSRPIQSISWDIQHAVKGEFDHFLLKEISEQVETIQTAALQDREVIEDITKRIRRAKGVFLIGCGSSFHACLSASLSICAARLISH